jgi:hypothetical protein
MASSITSCVKVGAGAWRYAWTGTAPFTVTALGRTILDASEVTSTVLQWDDGETHTEPPALEVYDSTEDADALSQTLYPPVVTLQFRGRATNLYYVIQQWDGAAWDEIATLNEDGSGYYRYDSPYWITGAYQVRVIPYDQSGTAGIPLTFSIFHNTAPAPELTYSYNDATGDLTVSA